MGRRKLYYIGQKAELLQLPSGRKVKNPHLLKGKAIDTAIEQNPGLEKYFSQQRPPANIVEEEE